MDDDVDTATSRQLSSAQRVDAWTVHAGMAQGGRDPDIPYIPDCIESEDEVSAVFNLHDMRQGLPGVTSGDQNVSVVVIAQDARHANRGKDTSASGRNDGAVVRRPGSHRRAMTTYASPLRQGASATARSHRGPRCHPPKFTTSASPPATPYLEPRGWQVRR